MGGAQSLDKDKWEAMAGIVEGDIVNFYSNRDLVLETYRVS